MDLRRRPGLTRKNLEEMLAMKNEPWDKRLFRKLKDKFELIKQLHTSRINCDRLIIATVIAVKVQSDL